MAPQQDNRDGVTDGQPTVIRFYSRKEGYGWLSNYWRSPMQLPLEEGDRTTDHTFPTNEHYYQSQKPIERSIRRWIAQSPSPRYAKLIGSGLLPRDIRPDWDRVRVSVMMTGLRAKFRPGSDLADLLLGTGDAVLEEDSPTDMFWGRLGENMLGKCLMSVRSELRSDLESRRNGGPGIR